MMSTSGSAAIRLVKGPVKIVSGVGGGRILEFSATMGHESHATAIYSYEQPLHGVNSHHRQPWVVEEIE
jgi:hypothetical protein